MENKYYIIIDCPPRSQRPDIIFKNILEKTNLNVDDFITSSIVFGEWMFELKNTDKINDFISNITFFEIELTNLYLQGLIRYAEWHPKN
jgi:hypothetical protein